MSLLGVTLSNDLTWNMHVECIVKRKAVEIVYYVISVKSCSHGVMERPRTVRDRGRDGSEELRHVKKIRISRGNPSKCAPYARAGS